MQEPVIIQGGMGAGVSGWRLARAVAAEGQLGVVSGTALASIFVRALQLGDPEGHLRCAVGAFPDQALAKRVLDRYFVSGGIASGGTFKRHPLYTLKPSAALNELTVLANFSEVFLAKEGHNGPVGINLLEKIVLPNLASLYGAMLAGVDYVIMGAGIPLEIPGALDALAVHKPCKLHVPVHGAAKGEEHCVHFDPADILASPEGALKRPKFLPIISSNVLAMALLKRATGRIDGFVVEAPIAGGHNAPPRGKAQFNDRGEPVYSDKDAVDLEKLQALRLPFWLAGGYASPERVREALAAGACGVQAGTLFALCEESGFDAGLRQRLIEALQNDRLDVFTDPMASPTGFPFKLALLPATLSEPAEYAERPRRCDLGFLRTAYVKEDGKVDFRCPAEPVTQYVAKGGKEADTEGRRCLCNGLVSNIGMPQHQPDGYDEKPLVTIGDDVLQMKGWFPEGAAPRAAEVVRKLLSCAPAEA